MQEQDQLREGKSKRKHPMLDDIDVSIEAWNYDYFELDLPAGLTIMSQLCLHDTCIGARTIVFNEDMSLGLVYHQCPHCNNSSIVVMENAFHSLTTRLKLLQALSLYLRPSGGRLESE